MLRKTQFYRVLYRPTLLAGGEREPVLFTFIVAAGLSFSGLNLVSFGAAIVLVVIGLTTFRMMAKADPMMTQVYRRQLAYQAYYAPRSRPIRTE